MSLIMTPKFWPATPNEDIAFLQEALVAAENAVHMDEVPIGAVLVDAEGNLIVRTHNLRESDQDPTGHAEIIALREAAKHYPSWRLEGATLYVTLEPCPMCLAACQQARIERVVFGAFDSKGGALSLGYTLHQDERLNHRFKVDFASMPRCGKILTDFFKRKRSSL